MDERIKEHLKHLNKYYLLLLKAREASSDIFLKDELLQGSSERFLQLAIESCLNVGNRLISLHQFEEPVSTPETYADIFREMESIGIIDSALCNRLVKMAKFRNRLVHLYWDIDGELVYQFIQENLEDFTIFREKVIEYLSTHKAPGPV
ncbi:MAG: DUF86 domain-containing protein [Desulfobacterales bacterium]|nr:DUF86 domain-containing protein [Desulfobacterales bacterium]